MNIVYISSNWKSLSHGNFVMGTGSSAIISPCALGRGGIKSIKREGDGGTPIGSFKVIEAYYRPDRISRPNTSLPLHPIVENLGWCDAPNDKNYNKKIKLPYAPSHERLMRKDHLYDLMVVLDYNISQRKRNAGSAIFFHLAHKDYRPTEGCVAVHKNVMIRFLERANSNTRFIIRQ